MKFFLPLFLASIMAASAVKPAISTLSTGDRAQLMKELAQWHQTYGSIAEAKGLLPIESASSSKMDDYLQRFYNNKLAIEEARRNNPKANFSSDHPFALLSEDEFKKYVGRTFESGKQALDTLPIEQPEAASVLATSVDWTTSSCMPAIRDQGQCGACWAFSATGVAEMGHCIVTGNLYVLSEQQVTSCSTNGGSQGCDGGYPWYAIDYTTGGLCLDSDWPYTSGKTKQTGSCSNSCTRKSLSIGKSVRVQGEDALAMALNTQPVSVTVEAGNSVWQNYQGGVITQCPGAQSDHAVIAVGYDGESYKVRNSWGSSWGEGGYIRLERGVGGVGTCNVVDAVSYPKLSTTKPTTSPSTQPSSKPTTAKPSTTKGTTAKPTTAVPSLCGSCTACYYPDGDSCYTDFSKSDCNYYSSDFVYNNSV
ncbi:hypothetical protein AC1031_004414 [Aphanomyces cochlioides]|nr:hypothetical protein AC1031_004414 [Aphanomyces cochlioides]